MITSFDYSFYLLCASTLSILLLLGYIYKTENKSQIHIAFMSLIVFILIWSTGHILEVITSVNYGYTNMVYVYMYYFGLIFVPVSLLFTGLIFVHTKLQKSVKYIVLLIFPIIDLLILLSDSSHHLYFIKYSIFNDQVQYGSFFIFHTLIQYAYIVAGLYYFVRFSIKNSGFFSKQSILIILGVMFPFVINVLQTASIINVPVYFTPISFSATIFFFSFAILKLGFLNITPIALQRIVDLISDSFIIINAEYEIIDYNRTFTDKFGELYEIKRKDNFLTVMREFSSLAEDIEKIEIMNEEAIHTKETRSIEKHVFIEEPDKIIFDKHFIIEITPIFNQEDYLGTIMLFKDITQSKKDMATIQAKQEIIMEQERMASLGHLIGGIAHNLKTPIMSISGGIEGLKDLVEEYKDSIGDETVNDDDHKEIATEMHEWLGKMKPHCSYMSDIISTVKGQAAQFNTTNSINFTVDELLKRVDLLMKHELNKYHCALETDLQIDSFTKISGEVSSLVQIFDNLIINAIHSYDGKSGKIDLKITKDEENILFALSDYGKGMSKAVQDKLFKNMVTTKGKEGTGLGLYMSYPTVRGRFGGDMWFESEEGKGTTFYVTIPAGESHGIEKAI